VTDRVDENGAAYAGSQLQTQLYAAVRGEFSDLADATFQWRSPPADDHYAEYWDAAFLKRLHLDDHVDALAKFWARRGGPHWDALALVKLPGEPQAGVLLAEGKSYPDEMLKGSGATATDPTSKCTIEKALAWTQGTLGLPLNTDTWTGPLYQNGNRLAHVYWPRSAACAPGWCTCCSPTTPIRRRPRRRGTRRSSRLTPRSHSPGCPSRSPGTSCSRLARATSS
jgi:hypothetical protein